MTTDKAAGRTSAIFVDDGGEDAYEFASNYIWFDPSDAEDTERAWLEARNLWHDRRSRLPADCWYDMEPPRLHAAEPEYEAMARYLESA